MRFLTVLPFAACAGGPGFAPLARAVSAETLTAVLGFASPATCLALVDDPDLAAQAEARGIRTLPASIRPGDNPLELSQEARAGLADFVKAARSAETAVMLVNPFNPQISTQRLKAAATVYLKAPSTPLFSVRPCRNHPCQFQRYLNIIDFDTLYLLDPEWAPPSPEARTGGTVRLHASQPFALTPTEQPFLPSGQGELASCRDGRSLSTPEDGLAIMRQANGLVRLIFAPDQQIAGLRERQEAQGSAFRLAGMFGHLRHDAALFHDARTGERRIFFAGTFPFQPGTLLRIFPFSAQGTLWQQAVEIPVPRSGSSCLLSEDPPDTLGYIVCVLDAGQNGKGAETMERFSPPLARWAFRKNKPYNLDMGCEITGRQVFPEVVRPDGSFAVLPLAMALAGSPAMENARAYVLPDEESLIVSDHVDYLRLLARRQAKATCTRPS